MYRHSILRYTSVGLVIGLFAALSGPAHGQILDQLRGRDTRVQSEWQPVERYYPPGQFRDQDGRVYRGGAEVRREYRGDVEYRGEDRGQVRQATTARRGTTLLGSTVTLEGGRSMGRVEDFVIGESNSIDFLVVSVSGIRGMSGRLAVVPFEIAEPDFSRRIVYVNWAEEDIRSAPIFFSSSSWPDFNDSRRMDQIFAFFEIDSRSAQSGRAYRHPADREERRSDQRSTRERDYDQESESGDRSNDSSRRNNSDRSTRDRDSYETDRDRDRSTRRSSSDDDSESSDRSRSSKQDLPD